MWYVFRDPSDGEHITMHIDSNGISDRILIDINYNSWVDNILDYTMEVVDDTPEHIDDYVPQLSIIHSFDSDDPISYIQSLPQIHPEFFI